jgi:hypothetical protein
MAWTLPYSWIRVQITEGQNMRTAGIKRLVEQALASLPKPHTEDVIDDVFHAIEYRPEWRKEYENLCTDLGRMVVNTWGALWIANYEGCSGVHQVPSKKSTLIGSYSKLNLATANVKRKLKEPEALKLMSTYYQEHRAELPAHVRNHRELIVELLMND